MLYSVNSITRSHLRRPEEVILFHTDYLRQIIDVSKLTSYDNMCLWPGWAVERPDVTFIAAG